MSSPYLSVVAPCYNEELVLDQLYARVSQVCRNLDVGYEIVLVNDGSSDKTLQAMHRLASEDPHLVIVNLSRNHGHQLALSAGLSECRGERVLVIDADLQDPPELLPAMLEKMDATGADVIYGQRFSRTGDSRFKRIATALFYRLLCKLTDVAIPLDTGDFRLVTRRVVNMLKQMPERQRYIRGMVSWIGFRQEPLLYERQGRAAGESKYPLSKLIRLAFDGMTSFSTRPLTFATWLGFGMGLASILLCLGSVVAWMTLDVIPGWTSLMAMICLIAGLQFLILGIMGEYLGRICTDVRQRPLFIIDEVIRADRFKTSDAGSDTTRRSAA